MGANEINQYIRTRTVPSCVNVVCRFLTCAVCAIVLCPALWAQSAQSLSQVKTLYVQPMGATRLAEVLQESLIKRLRKSGVFELIDNSSQADAIVRGSGAVWGESHVTNNSGN